MVSLFLRSTEEKTLLYEKAALITWTFSITHHLAQTLEVSNLVQEFLVVLVGLGLKELDILLNAWLCQFSEWRQNFLIDFVNQIDISSDMAVLHDIVEKGFLEVDFIADQIEGLCVLQSRDWMLLCNYICWYVISPWSSSHRHLRRQLRRLTWRSWKDRSRRDRPRPSMIELSSRELLREHQKAIPMANRWFLWILSTLVCWAQWIHCRKLKERTGKYFISRDEKSIIW